MKNEYNDRLRESTSYCIRISGKDDGELQQFAQVIQTGLYQSGYFSSISTPHRSNNDSLWYMFLDAKKRMINNDSNGHEDE